MSVFMRISDDVWPIQTKPTRVLSSCLDGLVKQPVPSVCENHGCNRFMHQAKLIKAKGARAVQEAKSSGCEIRKVGCVLRSLKVLGREFVAHETNNFVPSYAR